MSKPANIKSHAGLRGIAAFSVFMFHLYERESLNWSLSASLFRPFQWGGPAVDLFFMLSGFILNHVYLHGGNAVDWRSYFVARFARVVPLYYATLMVTPHKLGIFASILWNFFRYASWWGWGFVSVVLANLLMVAGLSGIRYLVNPPSWSISVEMVLYIVIFPILAKKALGLPRWFMLAGCGLLAVLLFSCHDRNLIQLPPTISGWSWMFLGRGIFGFILGFFLCSLLRDAGGAATGSNVRFRNQLIHTTVLLAAILSIGGFFSTAVLDLLFPVIVYFTARDEGLFCRILGLNPFQWLGDRSYSIYLWHYPLIAYYNRLPHSWIVMKYPGSALVNVAAMVLVVLFVSALSYRYFEVPCRNAIRTAFSRKNMVAI